jgi:hypothetical protein
MQGTAFSREGVRSGSRWHSSNCSSDKGSKWIDEAANWRRQAAMKECIMAQVRDHNVHYFDAKGFVQIVAPELAIWGD